MSNRSVNTRECVGTVVADSKKSIEFSINRNAVIDLQATHIKSVTKTYMIRLIDRYGNYVAVELNEDQMDSFQEIISRRDGNKYAESPEE